MLARDKVFAQDSCITTARLAQSAERKALNLVVVGSSPTVGDLLVKAGGLATKAREFVSQWFAWPVGKHGRERGADVV